MYFFHCLFFLHFFAILTNDCHIIKWSKIRVQYIWRVYAINKWLTKLWSDNMENSFIQWYETMNSKIWQIKINHNRQQIEIFLSLQNINVRNFYIYIHNTYHQNHKFIIWYARCLRGIHVRMIDLYLDGNDISA